MLCTWKPSVGLAVIWSWDTDFRTCLLFSSDIFLCIFRYIHVYIYTHEIHNQTLIKRTANKTNPLNDGFFLCGVPHIYIYIYIYYMTFQDVIWYLQWRSGARVAKKFWNSLNSVANCGIVSDAGLQNSAARLLIKGSQYVGFTKK